MKKKIKTIANQGDSCKLTCHGCSNCTIVNFEEAMTEKLLTLVDSMQLYSAEALSYYFYFLPNLNRALRG